jgi:hypothetical protein
MTPSRAFFTIAVFVNTFMPGTTGIAQLAIGLGDFATSTKHMRQFPAIDSLS